jgi:iron(III) transport system substrate-binding protein
VEQGRYDAAVTLANVAYGDQKKGSPIEVVWPAPGAVSVYAPIGVTTKRHSSSLADDFAAFAASRDGQRLMAKKGTYVTLPGLGGPPGGRTVAPEWPTLFDRYKALLAGYSTIYGG